VRGGNPAGSTDDAHVEGLETWFGTHAGEWRDAYRDVRRVNDLVLIERQDLAVAYVRKHVPEGGSVLDAGCGAGWASLELAGRGYAVLGVDLAPEMIDQCERTFADAGVPSDRYAFARGDLLTVDLAPASFDGIVALGVLQYQFDEGRLLERFRDLLRPGGVLVVAGPVGRSIPNLFGSVAAAGSALRKLRLLPRKPTAGRTQHRYSLGRLHRLLEAAGFEVIEAKGHGFGDWVVIGGVLGFRGELALHRSFTWISRLVPVGRLGNDLVVAARTRPTS